MEGLPEREIHSILQTTKSSVMEATKAKYWEQRNMTLPSCPVMNIARQLDNGEVSVNGSTPDKRTSSQLSYLIATASNSKVRGRMNNVAELKVFSFIVSWTKLRECEHVSFVRLFSLFRFPRHSNPRGKPEHVLIWRLPRITSVACWFLLFASVGRPC